MLMKDDQLLQWLHEGMFEAPLWDRFLRRLLAVSGARLVMLALRFADAGQPMLRHVTAGDWTLDAPDALLLEMFANSRQRASRVYDRNEIMGFIASERRATAASWLDAHGIEQLRSILTSGDSVPHVWLSCGGGSAVGPNTGASLLALDPHLKIAARNFATVRRERYRSAIADDAFNRLSMGWFSLDPQCRIVEMTGNMNHMLERGGPLRRGRYGRLVPESAEMDRRLVHLVRNLADGRDMRPQAFRLSSDPWIDMLVMPSTGAMSDAARPAVALAFVRGDNRSRTDRCDQLVQLFGLLPSEARLAWQLAQANSISDAAGSLGLTVETARNYSKKIYAKTGARGQADLVRIITTSVLAFH